MRRFFTTACLAVSAGLSTFGCAAQGGDDGGSANLPGRGIAGWEPTSETPVLRSEATPAEVGGPTLLVTADRAIVWFHQRNESGFELRRAEADHPGPGEAFVFGPSLIVLADGRDPSLVADPDHPDDPNRRVMAYSASDGLRLAALDGTSVTPLSATLPAGTSPSLVLDDGRLILYLVVDGSLARSEEVSPLTFSDPVPVLGPGVDCVDLAGEPEPCWDGGAIVDAEVRLAETPTGRAIWRVFYAARAGQTGSTSIGFAASDDGLTFSRYAFNPVLATGNLTAPASARLGDAYHLLTELRASGGASIGHHVSVPDAPADRF